MKIQPRNLHAPARMFRVLVKVTVIVVHEEIQTPVTAEPVPLRVHNHLERGIHTWSG